ncbi:hypothetical protein [Halobacterium jilantaiense]|uniref:Uncharacterized protein n=1 Tax=Halobacterium jilantaiense TaxID=355548 RepID=A0A1I0NVM5_9EURY|nr:hypothetical protein [Halobacterium jilantaiense]SEW05741.1 hypothetical protein SAMN04487945_1184 [Halobacterium jilantaiense]
MQERPSRRSVLASAGGLALAGLAGCTGDGGSDDATTSDSTATEQPATTADDTPSVDWDEVADFRTWLTEYSTLPSSNARFDYQSVGLESVVGVGRTSVFDLAPEDADGALVQSGNTILLGAFDADALVADVEASADYERTGEHEGYRTAEATETDSELAIGEDAVLAGSDLSVWVDTHLGERERLEETAPVFTHILRRLPHRGLVSAQYGAPAGGEIDAEEIDAWGTSMASLESGEGAWVYALEPDTSDAAVDELAAELGESAFTEEITSQRRDGRFVTFEATMPTPD